MDGWRIVIAFLLLAAGVTLSYFAGHWNNPLLFTFALMLGVIAMSMAQDDGLKRRDLVDKAKKPEDL